MLSKFNFGAAVPDETVVFGSAKPGASREAIADWLSFMKNRGIVRVCCLLDSDQLRSFDSDLNLTYEAHFGRSNVLMAPVPDYTLCPKTVLHDQILPFLRKSQNAAQRVVVHCWSGNGRTGHVLAAWLVAARGLDPMSAITSVEATGRKPREAVNSGSVTLEELLALLRGPASPGAA